jgi:hypothetical protein
LANAAIWATNLLSPLAILAVLGLAAGWRLLDRPMRLALGAITAIEAVFVARYNVPDQFTFTLPLLMMLGVWAALGAAWLVDRRPGPARRVGALWLACIALQPALLWAAPHLARAVRPDMQREVNRPFRDELRYWLVPWKQDETSARQFAQAALRLAAPDGIIVPDSTTSYLLMVYQEQTGLAPAVAVQHHGLPLPPMADADGILQAAAGRAIFLVSPESHGLPLRLAALGQWVDEGVLTRWSPAKPPQSFPAPCGTQYNAGG